MTMLKSFEYVEIRLSQNPLSNSISYFPASSRSVRASENIRIYGKGILKAESSHASSAFSFKTLFLLFKFLG